MLTTDTVWKGEVSLIEDILVPEGISLTITPGTVIRAMSAESTKTDPEYLSPLVEITIRGNLRAEGMESTPIRFVATGEQKEATWAGIIIDGGSVSLRHCRIESAETALHLVSGSVDVNDTTLIGNRYGAVIQLGGALRGRGNRITGNEYGLVTYKGSREAGAFADYSKNRKKDNLVIRGHEVRPQERSLNKDGEPPLSRSYGDAVISGETVWREKIVVNGIVRVPAGSRLSILPGTMVEFGERDTNGDGIGENGILIQGVIVAKGTHEAPIIFRASPKGRRMGGWDAINIMNSSGAWNIIENCRIEDAYRGLHFHFSRVAVTDSVFTNDYRGIQFQEATVLIRDNRFFANRSAVQGRDSDITFAGNLLNGNYQGINFLRSNLVVRNNRIIGSGREGVRIREGATVFEENLVDGNRFGLLVMDAFFGSFTRNSISNNGEIGFSLKNTDNIEVSGNFIAGNGLNGMSIQETRGRISSNVISDNGERGVGIQTFAGALEENNFIGNGLYAVDLEGSADVSANRNWWGGALPDKVIYDRKDDTTKGRVDYSEPSEAPFLFQWPLATVETNSTWRGDLAIARVVTIAAGATLTLPPGTRALFAEGAGLTVNGRIIAKGERERRVLFSSLSRKEPAAWGEIQLEHADGSIFDNCVIEYATWGIHSHFTRLEVSGTLFRHNEGGIRFRSGPVEIRGSLFKGNGIGIRDFRGNAVVSGNIITGNSTGVFVREKGGGLTLRGNNLFSNSDYNVRVGDFNNEDVDARENWWGKGDPGTTILDGRQEPGIGIVRYEPYLREAAPLEEIEK